MGGRYVCLAMGVMRLYCVNGKKERPQRFRRMATSRLSVSVDTVSVQMIDWCMLSCNNLRGSEVYLFPSDTSRSFAIKT